MANGRIAIEGACTSDCAHPNSPLMSEEDRITFHQNSPEGFAKRTLSYRNHTKRIMNMRIHQKPLTSRLSLGIGLGS